MAHQAFDQKIVLLTGAASGIGRALAATLCEAGARLHASDRDFEALQQASLSWRGTPASLSRIDVTESAALRAWIRETGEVEGRIDFLFSNAGIGMAGEFRYMTPEDWNQIIRVNLDSVFHGCHEAFQFMASHGGGHLVNTASMLGLTPSPLASLYSAAKYGVIGLSETLAIEGRDLNIRVSAVCPGYIATGIFEKAPKRETTTEDMLSLLPWKLYPAEKAAYQILQGVAARRRLIVFPAHARFGVWLWRVWPSLYSSLNRRLLEKHRSMPKKKGQ